MNCYTNAGGGGAASTAWAYIGVTYPAGSTCTATNGTITLNAQGTSGLYVFGIPEPLSTPETWTISCTDGTSSRSESVLVSSQYEVVTITLSYRRIPEEYQEVEYIMSNTSGYIDTGKYLESPTDTEIEFSYKIGEHDSSASTYRVVLFGNDYYNAMSGITQGSSIVYHSNNTSVGSVNRVQNQKINVKYNIYPTRKITEDGIDIGTCTGSELRYVSMCYGASRANGGSISGGSYQLYLYEYIRRKAGTIDQHLVPCYRVADDQIGMYDMVSDTFIAGNGTFVVGPDV